MLIHLQAGLGLTVKNWDSICKCLTNSIICLKAFSATCCNLKSYAYITIMNQTVLSNNNFHYFSPLEKLGK